MAGHRQLRVLLVDDEPDILLLLQALMTARSWEVVGRAVNGEDALRIAKDIAPDVAVVDHMMPGMSGLDLARALKHMRPGCQIVLFTAYEVIPGSEDAVDHVLSKTDVGQLDNLLTRIAEDIGR